MSYPNQYRVEFHKSKKEESYTIYNNSESRAARKNLATIGGLKMYMYLLENSYRENFYLSREAVMEDCGMGQTAYYNGKEELISKGYLVLQKKGRILHFYSSPSLRQVNTSRHESSGAVDLSDYHFQSNRLAPTDR